MDIVKPRYEIKITVQITTVVPIFRKINIRSQGSRLGIFGGKNPIGYPTNKSRPLLSNLITPFMWTHQRGQMGDKQNQLLDSK